MKKPFYKVLYVQVLFEVPSIFRLPKGGIHATCFSLCCSRRHSLSI